MDTGGGGGGRRRQGQATRGNKSFCKGSQLGTCLATTDGLHCAANPAFLHQCAFCKKQGHGENSCWAKQEAEAAGAAGGNNSVSAYETSGGGASTQTRALPWTKTPTVPTPPGRPQKGGKNGNNGNNGKDKKAAW